MRPISVLLGTLAVLFLLCPPRGQAQEGKATDKPKDDDKTVTKPTPDFSSIHVFASGKLILRKADKCGFAIRTPKDFTGTPRVEVKADRLMIMVTGKVAAGDEPIEVVIDVKDLKSLNIGNEAKTEVEGINAKELHISVTGTANLSASGKAQALQVSVGGSAGFEGKRLQAKKVVVSHGGTGKAVVHATEQLEANIVGKGVVEYVGSPKVRKSILGAGRVVKAAAE